MDIGRIAVGLWDWNPDPHAAYRRLRCDCDRLLEGRSRLRQQRLQLAMYRLDRLSRLQHRARGPIGVSDRATMIDKQNACLEQVEDALERADLDGLHIQHI